MTDLPERITIQRYYWDGERHQGTLLAYDGEKGFAGTVYRLEKVCPWKSYPDTGLIRAVNHHLWEVGPQLKGIKYCPVCGGQGCSQRQITTRHHQTTQRRESAARRFFS